MIGEDKILLIQNLQQTALLLAHEIYKTNIKIQIDINEKNNIVKTQITETI